MGSLSAKQVLYRSNGGEPNSLDPHKSMDGPDYMIKNDLFEGLVALDAHGNIIPGVALSWEISDDKLTYVFNLRKNARWSNGDPVTAHDFVYAFRKLVDPTNKDMASFYLADFKNANSILKGTLKDVNQLGVKALDDHTLEIQLESPIPYLFDILTSNGGYPLHQKTIETYGDKWTRPQAMVSNGPFVLAEWRPNEYVKLVKNEHFWDKENVKLEDVYFLSITEESVELKMFRTGQIDVTYYNFQSPAMMELMRKKAPETIRISPALKIGVYIFSMKRPAMQDKRVREALNLAVDRTLITEKVLFSGSANPAYSFSMPGLKNNLKSHINQSNMSRKEQCERARELYKEAGYSKENPLVVDLILPNRPNRRRVAIAVAEMIREVLGAQVNMQGKEFKVYAQQQGKDIYDIYDLVWFLDYNDMYSFLEQFSGSQNSMNAACYHNPQFDELLEKARKTNDFEKRDEILDQACQLLFDEHVVMPLFFTKNYRLVHPRLQGFHENITNVHGSRYMSINPEKASLTF
jgi:oligopeptide transport system substrate-binding protein